MDIDLIEKLMRLLETSTVSELELTQDGARIKLSKASARPVPVAVYAPAVAALQTSGAPVSEAAVTPAEAKDGHVIVAGLPGTFYRSPLPGEPPYVSVGDIVEDGRKLGIVEAMKMMNPVEADCAGRILVIHPEDGAAVSAGDALFTLEKKA